MNLFVTYNLGERLPQPKLTTTTCHVLQVQLVFSEN